MVDSSSFYNKKSSSSAETLSLSMAVLDCSTVKNLCCLATWLCMTKASDCFLAISPKSCNALTIDSDVVFVELTQEGEQFCSPCLRCDCHCHCPLTCCHCCWINFFDDNATFEVAAVIIICIEHFVCCDMRTGIGTILKADKKIEVQALTESSNNPFRALLVLLHQILCWQIHVRSKWHFQCEEFI